MMLPFTLRAVVVCLLVATAAVAQDADTYMRRAVAAYQAKDYPAYLDNMRHAAALRPNNPRLIYNLASANALNGNAAEAVAGLARLGSMGLTMPAAKDSDFDALRTLPAFDHVVRRLDENAKPAGRAAIAFSLPGKGVVAEGLAYDAKTRTFYVGSVHLRRIYAVDASGRARVFAEGIDALAGAFGMAVDARNRVLWVATSWMPQVTGCTPERDGKGGLVRFDLATGRVTGAFVVADSRPHAISDLAIGPNGDVYATDSKTPAIYRLRAGGSALEAVVDGEPFRSPQGLAVARDGKRLYIADYSRGLFVVDLAGGKVAAVACPDTVCLSGIDGLAIAGGALIAVQNGIRPHRVVRMSLDRGGTSVTGCDVLAAALPEFDEPTLGVVVGGEFYFVASSGWRTIGDDGALAPEGELRAPVVMKTGI